MNAFLKFLLIVAGIIGLLSPINLLYATDQATESGLNACTASAGNRSELDISS